MGLSDTPDAHPSPGADEGAKGVRDGLEAR